MAVTYVLHFNTAVFRQITIGNICQEIALNSDSGNVVPPAEPHFNFKVGILRSLRPPIPGNGNTYTSRSKIIGKSLLSPGTCETRDQHQ
jgi:hypothetical protein